MRMRHGWPYALALMVTMVSVRTSGGGGRISAPDPEPSVGATEWTGAVMATNAPATPAAPIVAPPPSPLTPAPSVVVDCFNFDTNAALTGGSLFIPPDPHGAVGPDHVIVIGNVTIEWRPKVGITSTAEFQSSLRNFFSALPGSPPGPAAGSTLSTFTFDPKVIYDQYRGRFVVVTLERWMTVLGNASNQSRILLAISKTSNPNDGWWLHAIDAKLNIGGLDRWVDYPGLACDDKAVYITGNMYSFAVSSVYGGTRVWIVRKTPAYDGPNNGAIVTPYDPFPNPPAVGTTAQPAHMFGVLPNGSTGRPLGTFLVSYSGLTDGTNEYLQIVELTDPLAAAGGPFFTLQQINLGDIENAGVALPTAPQLGSGFTIATNDRRSQNAVWRNNNLYTCATYRAPAAPNLNQSTARWWRINTTTPVPGLVVADGGNAGGEDIGAGAYTFFPSVMVDSDGNMAMNFALSGPTVYPGAYYATRMAGAPAGTLGATCTLHAGTDWYYRVFTGTNNRWGDFSALALCPLDEGDFWAVNEYAMTRGTITNGTQDGRWQMVVGKFRLKPLVSVAITSFDAIAKDGAVLLRAAFRSNLGVESVSVYRAGASGDMRAIATEFGAEETFEYTDRTAQPGAHYRYQIGVRDADGEFLSPVAEVAVPGLEAALGQNSPNPFNPSTTIAFTLPMKERVTIVVYDANGRLVRTLVDENRDFGTYEVAWDGRDDAGTVVGSGVYFYRLTAGRHSESKKMVLLK